MRLDRYLANMGCGTRSEVKQLLRAGKVMLNGKKVTDGAIAIQAGIDKIICQNQAVGYQEHFYLMLHKPAGVLSATEDQRQRTVLDLIDPKYLNKGLFPVGRLDKDTEGLLLLTNHGELGHRLLAPKKHVDKEYFVRVTGVLSESDQIAFQNGILLADDYQTMPATLKILSTIDPAEAVVVIKEGKFHQIKRMFQALDKEVIYLKRLRMGNLLLDPRLKSGEARELTAIEIESLLSLTDLLREKVDLTETR